MFKKVFISIAIANFLFLSAGCSKLRVYQPDVQQGNVITESSVKQLRIGMNRAQVEKVMGAPVLQQPLVTNRTIYVYTFKPGDGNYSEKRVVLTFYQNRLIRIANEGPAVAVENKPN